MALPAQEPLDPDKAYTADEVQHLLARWAAAYQHDQLKERVGGLETRQTAEVNVLKESITALGVKVEAAVNSLMHTIGRGSDQIRECRKELEAEISVQYATKIELTAMEGRINTSLSGIKSELKGLFIMGTIIVSAVVLFSQHFLAGG